MSQTHVEECSSSKELFDELASEIERAVAAFDFRHGPQSAGKTIATVAGVSFDQIDTLLGAREDPIAADAARKLTVLSLYLMSPVLGGRVSGTLSGQLKRLAGDSPLPSIFSVKTSKNAQADLSYQTMLVTFVELLAYQLVADRGGDDPNISEIAKAHLAQLMDGDKTDRRLVEAGTQFKIELALLDAAGGRTEPRSWQRRKKTVKKQPHAELMIRVSKATMDGEEPSADDADALRSAGPDMWEHIDHLISSTSTRLELGEQLNLIKKLHREQTR